MFISYSRDTEWLERLQVHLRALEREGLIDRWDETRIQSGQKWDSEIRDALATARVAILLDSADFLASDFIAEKELPALLTAAESERVMILPVIVKASRFKKTRLIQFQSVNAPENPLIKLPEWESEEILVKLADEVEAAMAKSPGEKAVGREGDATPLWTVPFERNFFFTGREAYLERLYQSLAGRGRAMLSGLGGTGKTQIAVEYAYRRRGEYEHVLWLTAETELEMGAGYAQLTRLLGLPEQHEGDAQPTVDAVKRWLEGTDGWLFVLDNANDPAGQAPFLPWGEHGHILLTSRSHDGQVLGIVKPIEIEELPSEEALSFLLKRTGREDASPEEREAARQLGGELGRLPLALEQAAAYVTAKEIRFADYLASFKKRRLELLHEARPMIGTHPEPLATTWAMNFSEVSRVPAAADLPRAGAFLGADEIPIEFFTRGVSHLGPALAGTLAHADEDPLALSGVLEPLRRYSLVRRDVAAGAISIHSLVQEVVRGSLDEDEYGRWVDRVVNAMNSALPPDEYRYWGAWDGFLAHARRVVGHAEDQPKITVECAWLLNSIGYHLQQRRFLREQQSGGT